MAFAWKADRDSNMVKPKAGLAAREFSQVHTSDFCETYIPTPAASNVEPLVAFAVENDWNQRQLDVKREFSQAYLDFNVYMKPL